MESSPHKKEKEHKEKEHKEKEHKEKEHKEKDYKRTLTLGRPKRSSLNQEGKDKEKEKEKEREKEKEKEPPGGGGAGGAGAGGAGGAGAGGAGGGQGTGGKPSLAIIKLEELQLLEAIGTGSFGQVYKAKYKERLVAVKFGDGTKKKDFAHELDLLSSVSHPNIVVLYGASAGTRFFLVMELGVTNLSNYYKTHDYELKEIVGWTMQIAEAMTYLHSHHIVHRDLKTANILLDSNNYVKLCDFGTARDFNLTTVMTFVGTISYMAPELLREMPVSEKIDVYAFAIVIWELITRQSPFAGWKPVQIIWFIAGENRRLPIPADANPFFRDLIESCWKEEPHDRMSFGDILTKMVGWMAVESVPIEQAAVLSPLADNQRKWNVSINMTMQEFKQLTIISELDEIKKKETELKERETALQRREAALTKEVLRLQEEENQDAANLLRRIKTCPPSRKGQWAPKFAVRTDQNNNLSVVEEPDTLLSPRLKTPTSTSPADPPLSPLPSPHEPQAPPSPSFNTVVRHPLRSLPSSPVSASVPPSSSSSSSSSNGNLPPATGAVSSSTEGKEKEQQEQEREKGQGEVRARSSSSSERNEKNEKNEKNGPLPSYPLRPHNQSRPLPIYGSAILKQGN